MKLSSKIGDPRLVAVLAVAVVGLLGLAVWLWLSGRPPGDDSAEAGFARDMIVHHAQAVQMAEIVRDKTESEEIRTLATDMVLTQQAQIGMTQGWLDVWGLSTTGTELPMVWMGHPTEGLMPGMATPEEINSLSELPPERADVLFLRLMITHHKASIPMSEAILQRTDRPEVRQLAEAIERSQWAEIGVMEDLLGDLVGDSAEVELQPANGSGTRGRATLTQIDGGVKVTLEVSGLPNPGTTYLAYIHLGSCAGDEDGGHEHGEGGHHEQEGSDHVGSHGGHMETGATMAKIEYPMSPVESDAEAEGSSTTVLRSVTLEGLLSAEPMKYVNVHAPGSGTPPPLACADLSEAK
jgi:uncharacterized protein (DUF305 family)